MTWTVRKIECGVYRSNDGTRDRAEIRKVDRRVPRPWRVYRLRQKLDGTLELGGADVFKTFAEAKNFCINKPGVWGR